MVQPVGVLALQGDFAEHGAVLQQLGCQVQLVRTVAEAKTISGIIIPGGESTAIGKLLKSTGLNRWIQRAARRGLPVYGTCAGAIVIAKQVDSPYTLRLIDITVQRNAYGRQLDSFTAPLQSTLFPNLAGVFIRAPKITRLGPKVKTLAWYKQQPVLVETDRILAGCFHPELTNQSLVHRYFIEHTRRFARQK